MRLEVLGADGEAFVLDDGVLTEVESRAPVIERPARSVYAAAHVVLKAEYEGLAHSLEEPGSPAELAAAIDWEATIAGRRFLDQQGLGIAEAMDTAQRFELGWDGARRLIEETARANLAHGFVAGAGADQLARIERTSQLIDAVVEQATFIQQVGGMPVVLPMPWLVEQGASEEDYVEIYGAIVRQLEGGAILHWLGEAFHAGLRGYFPGSSFDRILAENPDRIRGAKLSLLDADQERTLRRSMADRGQILWTGDDFHFTRLIRGGDPWHEGGALPEVERWVPWAGKTIGCGDFSHALLGILDAIARPAGIALRYLEAGDEGTYLRLMLPCEELSRWVFRNPTSYYKVGLALLAWLDGRQENRMLLNHLEHAREPRSLWRTVRLAANAGVFRDAGKTAERLRQLGGQVG